jgi:hypothetical protein
MRSAVVVPGGRGGPWAGMLVYAAAAAQARGATIRRMTWPSFPPGALDPAARQATHDPVVAAELDEAGGTPLILAKSLGSHAAHQAAERSLPAVWLTPLLHSSDVVAALDRATAPFLLVGGTADADWDSALARGLTPDVLEIPDADHGLSVPGPVSRTTAILGRVCDTIEDFLDTTIWR